MLRRWNNIGLSARTTLLMVIPMVMAVSILGYFATLDKIVSAEKNADQRSKTLVQHFSSMIELGMVAQDKQALISYADMMLREENVVSVLMQDMDKHVLVKKENGKWKNKQWKNNRENVKYSTAPVFLSGVTVGGIESEAAELNQFEKSKPIGFVSVGVLFEKTRAEQEEILLIGLISTVLGVAISSLIGFFISRAITKPILRLNETVSLLTVGHLSARVKSSSKGEIGALERGVNNMAVSLHGAQKELLDKVHKATNDLNLTVTQLAQRNVELEKSRRQAEKLGEEKTQFLARMSHELRTPLNAVVGFSRLIGKEQNHQQRQEYAQTIMKSASQLNSVIDDVLTFSKLKSSSLSLTMQAFNPRTVCEDIVVMLLVAAQEKNIELILLIDKNVPDSIEGDALKVSQVLTNLLNNAIKFTEVGEVIVRVECLLTHSGSRLLVSVTDTGCGINSQDIGELFNAFSQLENTLTRKTDGVGLGLSIAKRLAIKMGGDITIKSKKGKGSCFSLHLPLLNPHFEKSLMLADKKLTDKQVLLFDSHFTSSESLQNMLQLCGMNVLLANGFEQAEVCLMNHKVPQVDVSRVNSSSIDLLVLSFSTEQIMNSEFKKNINDFMSLYRGPILMLSVMSEMPRYLDMEKRDNLYHALKPLRQKDLYQKVLSLLKIDVVVDEIQCSKNTYTNLDNMYVLVAEDNAFNQTIIKLMLEERSARVKLVGNGADAIEAAKNETFNFILMDLHMPDCDGISAAKSIRDAGNASSKAPIILVTADVLSDINFGEDKSVIDQVLYKPVDEREFDKVLALCFTGCVKNKNGIKNLDHNKTYSHSGLKKINRPLQQEVLRLCDLIDENMEANNIKQVHEYMHQLVGVCGYYQLDDANVSLAHLKSLMKTNQCNLFLECLAKLRQLIKTSFK